MVVGPDDIDIPQRHIVNVIAVDVESADGNRSIRIVEQPLVHVVHFVAVNADRAAVVARGYLDKLVVIV